MSDLLLGFMAIGVMLAFIVLGMHIGIALIVTSFVSVWLMRSPEIVTDLTRPAERSVRNSE